MPYRQQKRKSDNIKYEAITASIILKLINGLSIKIDLVDKDTNKLNKDQLLTLRGLISNKESNKDKTIESLFAKTSEALFPLSNLIKFIDPSSILIDVEHSTICFIFTTEQAIEVEYKLTGSV